MQKVVLFDFDGTIADSLREVVIILNKISDEFGFSMISLKEVEKLRGKDYSYFLKNYNLKILKIPLILSKVKNELEKNIVRIKLQKDIKNVFLRLKKLGFKLGILTSNSRKNVRAFLKRNKINFFDYIYTEKSLFGKARRLKNFSKKYKISPEKVVYVGDEVRDIKAARQAGIKIFAVSWGYHNKDILLKYKPDLLIEKPMDIVKILEK